MTIHIPRKRVLPLFLIFFTLISCQNNCRQWELTKIPGVCPTAMFSRVSLMPCSQFNGIEAEFLCINGEIHLFLNSLLFLFPCTSTVCITINNITTEHTAERLEGGQRLKMSLEATEAIVKTLSEGSEVIVTVGKFQETLIPTNFQLP